MMKKLQLNRARAWGRVTALRTLAPGGLTCAGLQVASRIHQRAGSHYRAELDEAFSGCIRIAMETDQDGLPCPLLGNAYAQQYWAALANEAA